MITINLDPMDDAQFKGPVTLSFTGTVMTLDGTDYDLSEMPDGADVAHPEFSASRNGDEYTVKIRLRYINGAPHHTRFPEPIEVTEDGPVELPPYGGES